VKLQGLQRKLYEVLNVAGILVKIRNQDESGLGARWIFSLLTFRTGKEGRN
jgi:hypothetical protein